MTPAEKTLADEHDAVLRRALADHQDGPGQGWLSPMTNNSNQSAPDPTSPSIGHSRHESDTARKSQREATEDTYPPTSQPPLPAVTDRSDLSLPTETEGAASARTVAGETPDDITATRRELLDRLART